jgi:CBS domain containing-hemolysin-like protein
MPNPRGGVLRRGMNKGIFAGIILIVGVGILVASFAAYSEISVVRVEAKSIISAPTNVLWQIMTEVDKYPQW